MFGDIKKPPEVTADKLKGTLDNFGETIKKQGEECERRHNVLCQIKEIIDEYFKEKK